MVSPGFELDITRGADPGELIGYRKDGRPIFAQAGGARDNFDNWIPEEFDSDVIQRVRQVSALETRAQRVPMGTETRSTPRSGGVGVDYVTKGGTYGEDTTTNDQVVLTAAKFGKAIRIADEDINDSLADIIAAKQIDWATSYAKAIDNACLAVTAASGATVPFNSVYYALTQTNSNSGYTANTNLTQCGTGGVTYDTLANGAAKYENGDYFDPTNTLVIASPTYKNRLREIKDTQGRPIFQESSSGFPGGGTGDTQAMVWGYPVIWSLGARTSPVPTQSPAGNPLMIFCNPLYLLLGIRSGPESVFIDGRGGLAALTDEAILKMRARRAFALGHENAFAVIENNSGTV